ncbi:hypothetical protein K470DRAFT_261474 [Piedraia hortae CBS 480.64]|uniref:Uncharacterized protein n=1 Tax=Piedraia hortae CBS 480.64 TaxID=1314780 RepID=A0A6A7CA56_9PEZI|nr:hypothetical protein K470DRAFT_261474 [Piedraia hortae CBS 480.64]
MPFTVPSRRLNTLPRLTTPPHPTFITSITTASIHFIYHHRFTYHSTPYASPITLCLSTMHFHSVIHPSSLLPGIGPMANVDRPFISITMTRFCGVHVRLPVRAKARRFKRWVFSRPEPICLGAFEDGVFAAGRVDGVNVTITKPFNLIPVDHLFKGHYDPKIGPRLEVDTDTSEPLSEVIARTLDGSAAEDSDEHNIIMDGTWNLDTEGTYEHSLTSTRSIMPYGSLRIPTIPTETYDPYDEHSTKPTRPYDSLQPTEACTSLKRPGRPEKTHARRQAPKKSTRYHLLAGTGTYKDLKSPTTAH